MIRGHQNSSSKKEAEKRKKIKYPNYATVEVRKLNTNNNVQTCIYLMVKLICV